MSSQKARRFEGMHFNPGQHGRIEFRDGGNGQEWKVNVGEVDWSEPSDRIHRAVNIGKEVFEEVVTFFLDRPDSVPQPEED